MSTAWVAIAVGVGALAAAVKGFALRKQRRETQALKADISKWEDEGGNLPRGSADAGGKAAMYTGSDRRSMPR